MKAARESDWLSAPGEYQDLISKLCASDPRLRSRCSKNLRQGTPWPNPNARLVVLETGGNGDTTFGNPIQHEPASLKAYLDSKPAAGASSGRVFILEGLHSDFIAVLGSHFKLHPSVFVEQERIVVIQPYARQENDLYRLPSVARTSQHYTMKYYEMVRLPPAAQNRFRLNCAETGRHIGVTRAKGEFLEAGIVRRKCTVWRQVDSNGGWDCLILTDPPLRAIDMFTGTHPRPPVASRPRDILFVPAQLFQNGYVDFMPHAVQMSTLAGPPRTSMLDDLCFYLQRHSSQLSKNNLPDAAAVFAKKIVAAHYLQLYNFTRSVTSHVQFHVSRLDRTGMDFLESSFVGAGQWSDAQALERRASEYCADIEDIMLQCDIPLKDCPDPASCAVPYPSSSQQTAGVVVTAPAWDDCSADFQVLRMRLADVRRRAELLNASVMGLASMSGNQQALREARNTKALTLVGLVFIPLAYTATLFSMTEPFGPGGERFWVYFAVSLPLIVCVFGGYIAMDAYGAGAFSLRSFSLLR